MVSNIANRNISLMFAIASFCGLIYCIYATIYEGTRWTNLCPIITSTAIFTKFYLSYRKQVKKGNIYGKVNLFK